jgi:hypothetical protein
MLLQLHPSCERTHVTLELRMAYYAIVGYCLLGHSNDQQMPEWAEIEFP